MIVFGATYYSNKVHFSLVFEMRCWILFYSKKAFTGKALLCRIRDPDRNSKWLVAVYLSTKEQIQLGLHFDKKKKKLLIV